jgi:hypothetical protein
MCTNCFNTQYIDILLTHCMPHNSESEQGPFVNRLGFTTEKQGFGRGKKWNIIIYYSRWNIITYCSRTLWSLNVWSNIITVLYDTIKCHFVDTSFSGEPAPSVFKVSYGSRQQIPPKCRNCKASRRGWPWMRHTVPRVSIDSQHVSVRHCWPFRQSRKRGVSSKAKRLFYVFYFSCKSVDILFVWAIFWNQASGKCNVRQ